MEKHARLKLVLRRLPWHYTLDAIQQVIRNSEALNGKVEVLHFQHGKAPSRYKGSAAVPAWATVLVANVATREAIVAAVDGKTLDPAFPQLVTCVEFCPLQRVSHVAVARTEIKDDLAGTVLDDPQYIAFAQAVEATKARTLETDVGSLNAWLQEQSARELALQQGATAKATSLVEALIGKWYQNKKLPWEIRADKAQEQERSRTEGRGKHSGGGKNEGRKEGRKGGKSKQSPAAERVAERMRSRGANMSKEKRILKEMGRESDRRRDGGAKKKKKKQAKETGTKTGTSASSKRSEDDHRRHKSEAERKAKAERDDRKAALIRETKQQRSADREPGRSEPQSAAGGSKFSVTKASAPAARKHVDPDEKRPPRGDSPPRPPAPKAVKIMKRPPASTEGTAPS